jgi:D-glycero-alpha-D-manno-heptose-7-phosphate kinase
VTTREIDSLIGRAVYVGATAAKVCGAGGGGCIAFLCDEGARESVETALAAHEGAEVLKWNFARDGLVVREI